MSLKQQTNRTSAKFKANLMLLLCDGFEWNHSVSGTRTHSHRNPGQVINKTFSMK